MNATKAMTLLAAVAVGLSAQALTLAVKDVKIAQRYPWNGLVDIDYTVVCDDPDADVYVYPVGYDVDMNLSIPPKTLTGDGANGKAVKAGTHRMTWDMAKDMGENYNRAKFSMKVHAYAGAAPYMVIDLSAGSNAEKYEVSYMSEMPDTEWPVEYKTTKLVLKLIPPGTFTMGSPKTEYDAYVYSYSYHGYEYEHKVTLTQPFYCSVFEITGQQRALIMGGTSSDYNAYCGFSYNDLRGSTLGAKWPEHQQVDATSFLGKLRSRTGVTFDLPTEAQWEYVCRAWDYSRISSMNPNAFGVYNMNKLPAEWCLDWFKSDLGTSPATDPKGPTTGSIRCIRGGVYTRYRSGTSYTNGYDTRTAARVYRNYNQNDIYPSWNYYYGTSSSPSGTDGSYFGCRLVALPAAK